MMKIIIACIATFLLANTSVCYSQTGYVPGQPSIDCNQAHNAVAVILCRVPQAAQADWELNSARWARYFTVNDTQRQMLDRDQHAWIQSLYQVCALPRYQTQEDQAGRAMAEAFGRMMLGPGIRIPGPQPINQAHVNCVVNAYHARAAMLRSKLTGDALAESHLSPEQHAELQQALAEKGFLRPNQLGSGTHDGEFGPITRNAIKQFQQSLGAAASGFLSNDQRSALAATAGAPRSMTPDTPSPPDVPPEWLSPLPSMGAQNTPGATAQAPATTAGQANRAIKEAEEAMGHDNGRALYLLLPLARQNNPKAEVILGTIFRFGHKGRQAPGVGPTGYEDVPRDDATAAILFRRAADQGDFDGESNLALMYKEGAGGLPKDYRQAAAWYLEAAHQNDPYVGTAQIILGQIYEEGGYGVLRNYVEAYKWYDIAAAHKSFDTKKGCPIDDPSDSTCAAALQRDLLAVKMTQAQITEAERLSHEWKVVGNNDAETDRAPTSHPSAVQSKPLSSLSDKPGIELHQTVLGTNKPAIDNGEPGGAGEAELNAPDDVAKLLPCEKPPYGDTAEAYVAFIRNFSKKMGNLDKTLEAACEAKYGNAEKRKAFNSVGISNERIDSESTTDLGVDSVKAAWCITHGYSGADDSACAVHIQ